MALAADLLCEGCGAQLTDEPRDFPHLCMECNGLVSSPRPRRQPRTARHISAQERRAISEPRACPYCLRHFTGSGLVKHLRDVHHATMTLQRDGVRWPPQPHNDP